MSRPCSRSEAMAGLTVEEATAALSVMIAGRRSIPPIDELLSIVSARTNKLSPATARLIADLGRATTEARRASDPIARSLADLVACVLEAVKEQVEQQNTRKLPSAVALPSAARGTALRP